MKILEKVIRSITYNFIEVLEVSHDLHCTSSDDRASCRLSLTSYNIHRTSAKGEGADQPSS